MPMGTAEKADVSRSVSGHRREHAVAFDDPHVALSAAHRLKQAGYYVVEAYTPFAVHGMDEALGFKESRLPWATMVGGTLGALLGLGFTLWTHAVDWPLNIGGKGFVAWEAIFPVAFEVVVLLSAFATLGALLFSSRLWPRTSPQTPRSQPGPRVSDDHFILVVEERDGSFDWEAFEQSCRSLNARNIQEGWRVT